MLSLAVWTLLLSLLPSEWICGGPLKSDLFSQVMWLTHSLKQALLCFVLLRKKQQKKNNEAAMAVAKKQKKLETEMRNIVKIPSM